jgi:PKD repeat protein
MPLTVLFTYNSTGGTPTSWYWDFGDGINSKHAQTATHTFKKPGTYDVSLTVTNFAGNSTLKKSNYITVTPPQAPIADFFSPEVYHADTYGGSVLTKTVSFVDNSTGSPTSWLWDFGDGNTSTEQNPTHVYDVGGGYTVNLTVKNAVGSNTTSKYGYVLVGLGDGLVAREYFSSNVTSGDAPLKVTFYGGTGYANDWTFGDGSNNTLVKTRQ